MIFNSPLNISPMGRRGQSFTWDGFWATLQGAVVENAAPTKVVMTFTQANTTLLATDFSIEGKTITLLERDATNKILTLTLSTKVIAADSLTVTLNKDEGFTHAVTNNSVLVALPTRNTDTVYYSGIDQIRLTGTPMINSAVAGINLFSRCRRMRHTGPGLITNIKFNFQTITGRTSVVFYHYRLVGATYDQLYSEEILPKITANNEIKDVQLATPIQVQEGDYVGMRIAGGTTAAMTGLAIGTANSTHYYIGTAPTDPMDWNAQTGITDATPIYCYGRAPLIVGIGDSMMESYPWLTSMIDPTYVKDEVTKSWMYKMYQSDSRFVYSCCGAGGQTTTQIQASFQRDCTDKKPKFAVIDGGFNDISASALKTTFISKWTSMLNACAAGGIIPVVWLMTPWTDATNEQMQTRDDWNASLAALAATYTGAIVINFDNDLGQFRAGGDVGNKWDIQPAYDDDGQHLNEAGQAKLAEVTLRQIGLIYA